ncbi:MAG TPA: TetR/AcrR family transcriptional regulator [Actinophytocola sp.]|uniref:TetR/AcrR family transcriptional regulator n=1 Tax=Actinophytocola sp. TaxID=1872138 RepID=UPI002DBDDDF4|nr:TetR/AcrR family transcriptional regulator [Actinophytocola sp.]HEU5472295.1 TetR/AcrR family transcriptional regulator [Actinophytocola sp.]
MNDRPPTREVLLDAALSVFTEQTYGGAAVAEVAKRAGMSVGTLYRYFPSKEALGNAVFRRWKGELLDRLTAGADPDEPVRTTFRRAWGGLVAFAAERPDAFGFLEFQQHESYLDEQSAALSARVSAMGEEMVVRGQRVGEIRAGEPLMLLALVYGAAVGLARTIHDGLVLDRAQLAAAEDAAWALLAKPEN